MPPPSSRPACQICQASESKYNCPRCKIPYCSFGCYKTHQEQPNCVPASSAPPVASSKPSPDLERQEVEITEPLRPLTSLKWPYVPEESAYPDPLKRDDPKIVQLPQYEEIATSAAVRKALSENPSLKPLLRSIDSLRGTEREAALQRALGLSPAGRYGGPGIDRLGVGEDDVEAVRQLSSVIDGAIRGDKPSTLGLDLDGE